MCVRLCVCIFYRKKCLFYNITPCIAQNEADRRTGGEEFRERERRGLKVKKNFDLKTIFRK